jgi:hypothetical protein
VTAQADLGTERDRLSPASGRSARLAQTALLNLFNRTKKSSAHGFVAGANRSVLTVVRLTRWWLSQVISVFETGYPVGNGVVDRDRQKLNTMAVTYTSDEMFESLCLEEDPQASLITQPWIIELARKLVRHALGVLRNDPPEIRREVKKEFEDIDRELTKCPWCGR